MTSRSDSLARPLAVFALLALVALGLVAGTGVAVVRDVATDQALAEARQLTDVSARLVERRLTGDGLLTGDAVASAAVARIVFDAVLVEPIVRVKLWTREGRIVYSDESRLIGIRPVRGALQQSHRVDYADEMASVDNARATSVVATGNRLAVAYVRIHLGCRIQKPGSD